MGEACTRPHTPEPHPRTHMLLRNTPVCTRPCVCPALNAGTAHVRAHTNPTCTQLPGARHTWLHTRSQRRLLPVRSPTHPWAGCTRATDHMCTRPQPSCTRAGGPVCTQASTHPNTQPQHPIRASAHQPTLWATSKGHSCFGWGNQGSEPVGNLPRNAEQRPNLCLQSALCQPVPPPPSVFGLGTEWDWFS